MAVIGGTSDPLKKELATVDALGRQLGVNLQRSLNSGGGHMKTGALRETLVMFRELANGNLSRLPSSFTVMAQQMGLLEHIIKDNKAASDLLADAWQKEAEKAGLAAMRSAQKAAASSAALYAEGGETEATLAAAVADERKAAADILTAKTTQAKAKASAQAAAAASAEGTATKAAIGPLGLIAAVFVGIAAGATAAWKLAGALKDRLVGLKAPDIIPDYIARINQKGYQQIETQRQINKEIERSVYLYQSVAAAAERAKDVTKTRYEHELAMNKLAEERALAMNDKAGGGTVGRQRIREQYAARELQLKEEQRRQEMANKITEQMNLELEAKRNRDASNGIQVNSKQHDENLVKQAKAKADEAREYIKMMTAVKSGNWQMLGDNVSYGGRDWKSEYFVKNYNEIAHSGVTNEEVEKADQEKMVEAHRRIQEEKDAINRSADNDILRERKEELRQRAKDSAAKAEVWKLEIEHQKKLNAQQAQNQAEESKAKLAAQKAQDQNPAYLHGNLTSLQRQGAYASQATSTLIDVNRQTARNTAQLVALMQRQGSHSQYNAFGQAVY